MTQRSIQNRPGRFAGTIAVLASIMPLSAATALAGPSEPLISADDTGTFTLATPATWTEVWSDPAADDTGTLYPRIIAAPPGSTADFAAPGVVLSSWPGAPAPVPDPAHVGQSVPDDCTEVQATGPAPLPALPNAITAVWNCPAVTFTSVQGNTADGTYLVAITLRTPLGDEALRTATLDSLSYAGGTGPAALPPIETAGVVIDDAGDPATASRLRVERTVGQASTTTHDVSLSLTGAASNEALGQTLSQDRTQSIHLVGSAVTRGAELDGSYSQAVTLTQISDHTQTPDGAVADSFTPLIGVAFERSFGPDGLFVGADLSTAAAGDGGAPAAELDGLIDGLPAESISLPAAPVGVGATWTAPASFSVLPVTATAPARHRLEALEGDRFTVSVSMDVDLATVERDAFTESNTGRFTRSMTIVGSLTNATDLTITRNESAQLTSVESATGTVYEIEMTLTATSVEVPG